MLIVEELHMLLLRPDGRVESAVSVNRLYGEVAAVIVDLALHGRISVSDEKNPVIDIVSTEPTGNPILDTTLQRLVPLRGKRLQSLVVRPKLDPLEVVVESLVVQGVLVRGERGFFGWGSARTPESDSAPEQMLRSRLAAVLAGTAAPTQADLALLSILQNLNSAHAILRDECGGMSARDLKKRIEELTAGSPAGDAVAKAVNDAIAAAMVAIMTPTIVAATIT
ncbi:GPP34 family phosphoprotein [Microbacterium sp. APC 3901]|uniref:GOLPH3/VPS74 family protein n=1 Tax=Microbacterium sp. APC 3901 TaxID=3035192 RepID=UPI0025B41CAA|nr:GPP34 family phosphoprotein [Microbacterium sp. APC 3901]MDN3445427.1 GPP34 family phosphoprotein [Microbacterium sp. APC 3901]